MLTDDILNGNEIEIDKLRQLNQDLQNKLDAMIKRNLYSKYKTAPTEEYKKS